MVNFDSILQHYCITVLVYMHAALITNLNLGWKQLTNLQIRTKVELACTCNTMKWMLRQSRFLDDIALTLERISCYSGVHSSACCWLSNTHWTHQLHHMAVSYVGLLIQKIAFWLSYSGRRWMCHTKRPAWIYCIYNHALSDNDMCYSNLSQIIKYVCY